MSSPATAPLPPSRIDCALLILRIDSALVFLYHGSAILFGAFGGPGPQRFAGFLHAPVLIGYLIGLAQFLGALAMLPVFLYGWGQQALLSLCWERFSWCIGSTVSMFQKGASNLL